MKKNRIATILSLTVLLVCTGLTHASAKPMINSIRFESPSATEDRIIFELNGPHLPTGKALPGDNPRIYFDFPDTAPADKVKTSMPANGNFVKQIRYAYHKGEKSKTRVVFDLVADRKMDFKQDFDKETNTLVITLYLAGTSPEPIIAATPEPEPVPAEEPGRPETAAEDAGKEIRPIEDVNIAVAEEPKEMAPAPEAVIPESPAETAIPEPEQASPETQAEIAMPASEPESKPVTAEPEPARPETLAEVIMPAPEPESKLVAAEPEPEPASAPQEKLPQIAVIPPSTRTQDMLEEPGEEATIIQPLSEIGIQPTEGIGSEPTVLHSIEFDPKSNRGEMISFKLNGFNPPVVFGIEEDVPRIVCFFKNTSAGSELSDMLDTKGQYVTNIEVGKYKNPDNIRVVLELVPGNNYDLQQIFFKDDQIFMMIINKAGKQISTQSN